MCTFMEVNRMILLSVLLSVSLAFPFQNLTNLLEYNDYNNLHPSGRKFINSTNLLSINGTIIMSRGEYIWNSNYAPYNVPCPSTPLIREARNVLGDKEQEYIDNKHNKTEKELKKLFSKNRIPGFDFDKFNSKKSKNTVIALAISGGGYRSMLTGAGILEAYDNRTPNSTSQLSGLLQSMSYIGGISGGSWLVVSNLVNDFKPIYLLKDDSRSWSLQQQLLEGVPNFDPNKVRTELGTASQDESEVAISEPTEEPLEGDDGALNSIVKFFGFGKSGVSEKGNLVIEPGNKTSPLSDGITSGISELKSLAAKKTSFLTNLVRPIFSRTKLTNETIELEADSSWKEIFSYYKELHIEVRDKRDAGFYLSLTDYWGRALARRIFTNTARTPGATISSSTKLESFREFEQPFPIICAVERLPSYTGSSKDSHLFEFSPFEFGSWDSYLNAFIPLKYLGSKLFNGKSTHHISNGSMPMCVSGFDNVGFITGTSSSLFNHIFIYLYKILNIKSDASLAIEKILKTFGLGGGFKSLKFPQLHPDYALYSPNPFYGLEGINNEITKNPHMYLVDGGDDGQNIPFHPFLRRARNVDIIISFDMTADTANYPNGTSLRSTVDRFHNTNSSHNLPYFTWTGSSRQKNQSLSPQVVHKKSVFPHIPHRNEFMSQGLNERPVFFGCNLDSDYPILSSTTIANESFAESQKDTYLPPIIVYMANMELTYPANKSTFQLSYSKEEIDGMIENGSNLATYMNSTLYQVCLKCAILKREFDRIHLGINQNFPSNYSIPSTCKRCYDSFCWSSKSASKATSQKATVSGTQTFDNIKHGEVIGIHSNLSITP